MSARLNFARHIDEGPVFDALTRQFPNHRIFRAAYAQTAAVTGAVDAMVDMHNQVWDLAAGQVLIEEAGGRYALVRDFLAADGARRLSAVFGKPGAVDRLPVLMGAPRWPPYPPGGSGRPAKPWRPSIPDPAWRLDLNLGPDGLLCGLCGLLAISEALMDTTSSRAVVTLTRWPLDSDRDAGIDGATARGRAPGGRVRHRRRLHRALGGAAPRRRRRLRRGARGGRGRRRRVRPQRRSGDPRAEARSRARSRRGSVRSVGRA